MPASATTLGLQELKGTVSPILVLNTPSRSLSDFQGKEQTVCHPYFPETLLSSHPDSLSSPTTHSASAQSSAWAPLWPRCSLPSHWQIPAHHFRGCLSIAAL